MKRLIVGVLMSLAFLNGIRIVMDQNATIADYNGLVGQAAAEMIQFRETWGDDDFFAISRTGDAYTLQRVNGQDMIIMGPVLREEKEDEEEAQIPPRPAGGPVPAFDLFDVDDFSYFLGFYVNPAITWDSPVYPVRRDDTLPHRHWNYEDNQYGVGEISYVSEEGDFRLYALPLISVEDAATQTGTFESSRSERFGAEELYESIEDYLFGVVGGDWHLTAYSATWAEMKDLNTGQFYLLWMHESCMRKPWIAFQQDKYTNSFWTSVIVEDQDSGRVWPPDDVQIWTQRFDSESTYGITICGQQVAATASSNKKVVQSIGNLSLSGDCVSETVLEDIVVDSTLAVLESCKVQDVENYDNDTTWMVTYSTITAQYTDKRDCSPWIHEPDDNDLGDFDNPIYTRTYMIKVNGAWGDAEFAFAASDIGNSFGVGTWDSVTVWRTRIFDYHGEPVYVWSWKDYRTNTGHYGMIYNGDITLSEGYPMRSFDSHEVDAFATDELGGVARLSGCAFGIEEWNQD